MAKSDTCFLSGRSSNSGRRPRISRSHVKKGRREDSHNRRPTEPENRQTDNRQTNVSHPVRKCHLPNPTKPLSQTKSGCRLSKTRRPSDPGPTGPEPFTCPKRSWRSPAGGDHPTPNRRSPRDSHTSPCLPGGRGTG